MWILNWTFILFGWFLTSYCLNVLLFTLMVIIINRAWIISIFKFWWIVLINFSSEVRINLFKKSIFTWIFSWFLLAIANICLFIIFVLSKHILALWSLLVYLYKRSCSYTSRWFICFLLLFTLIIYLLILFKILSIIKWFWHIFRLLTFLFIFIFFLIKVLFYHIKIRLYLENITTDIRILLLAMFI